MVDVKPKSLTSASGLRGQGHIQGLFFFGIGTHMKFSSHSYDSTDYYIKYVFYTLFILTVISKFDLS